MGVMIEGRWQTEDSWCGPDGRYVRTDAPFRDWITADGSSGFPAEAGRYHLYVSLACPWVHRTLIVRALKGLEDSLSLSVVDPFMGEDGWAFRDGPGNRPDSVNGAEFLRDVYRLAKPDYTGRVSVPVLWDKQRSLIVNNESSEIVCMFNSAFDGLPGVTAIDLYPEALRPEIDKVNARVYDSVNNGVYKAGFATAQGPYEEAFDALFESLDWLEERLGRQRYLCGPQITEADWRLFTTLLRFDPVYVGHFKCNLRRVADYPNLSGFLRELYQRPGVAATCNLKHIKRHYYESHRAVNPTGIVPKGPVLGLDSVPGRDHL